MEALGIIFLMINSPAFVLAGLIRRAWWPGAVFAFVDRFNS
jgi:hypothetical protein